MSPQASARESSMRAKFDRYIVLRELQIMAEFASWRCQSMTQWRTAIEAAFETKFARRSPRLLRQAGFISGELRPTDATLTYPFMFAINASGGLEWVHINNDAAWVSHQPMLVLS